MSENGAIKIIKENPNLLIPTIRILIYLMKKKREGIIASSLIESISDNFSQIELVARERNTSELLTSDINLWTSELVDIGDRRTDFISVMVKEGFIDKKEFERIVTCPICGSPKIKVELHCPYCNSPMIEPDEIVHHIICGYTGPKKSFLAEDKLVCPNCKMIVFDRDIKILGKSFFCESCNRMFRTPTIKLVCLNYNTTLHKPKYQFDLIDSKMRKLYGFDITEKGEMLLFRSSLIVDALRYMLSSTPEILVKTGEEMKEILKEKYKLSEIEFSAIFMKDGKFVAFDIAEKDPLPILFKAGILMSLKIPYIVVSHPDSLRALSEAEKTYENLHVVSLLTADLENVKGYIISLLSGREEI